MEYNVLELIRELSVRSRAVEAEVGGGTREPSPEDLPLEWRIEWEQRAAIMEYDGRLPRERAEALALAEIRDRMRQASSARPGPSSRGPDGRPSRGDDVGGSQG